MEDQRSSKADGQVRQELILDEELPQCKIKRNYSCSHCKYFTQNPRFHLTHLRDIHGERITINKCNLCLYASRHYQKLVRHMKMVHGSTDGIAGQQRKRAESSVCTKAPTPPLPPLEFPIEVPAQSENLSKDLELSRKALKDFAALYFAENHIGEIMSQMEVADAALLLVASPPPVRSLFDEIEESFARVGDLKCPCGHVSKSFSEKIVHRRACNRVRDRRLWETPSLSEARCQYCRLCCKSGAELANHLKNCLQHEIFQRSKCKALGFAGTESHLWTRDTGLGGDGDSHEIKEELTSPPSDEISQVKQEPGSSSFKKVFKCPRCVFWASTASRFHVHVVGHLNKKPFKCSLCTYRSNWRWDITKHIRLKSIRNPCHKSARVLMNDDTGRRNYTKYNKYLTLMKMNDEDGDSKLIKSGEMTPNQVASLGYLRESSPSDLANDVAVTECGEVSALANEKQRPSTDEREKVSSSIVKFSDDLVIDFRSNGLKKERFFKCRKCSYRHVNRDAVLAHIRIHYQNIQRRGLSSSTSKEDLQADGSLTRDPKPHAERTIISVRVEESRSTEKLTQGDDGLLKAAAPSGDENSGGPTPSPTPPASSSLSISDASKSALLMDVITASNFSNTPAEKKVSSPFRCGHCHQVSNWKHVIQRHCRLKHFGNIQIEAFDRSSDDHSPVYRAIDFPGSEQKRHSKGTTPDKADQQISSFSDNSKMATKGKSVLQKPDSSCNFHNDHALLSPKTPSKQLKCPSLPAVAQAPSQLKSVGDLTNHVKVHKSVFDPKPSDSDQVTPTSAVDRVGVATDRPKCPQTFINAPRKQKQVKKSADAVREVKSECESSTSHETMSENLNSSQDDTALKSVTLPKTASVPKSTASHPIDVKKPSKTKTVLTQNSPKSSHAKVDSKNPLSCAYCPFKTDSSQSFKSHLQHHLREYSNIITPSRDDLHEHSRLNSKSTGNKSSPASHTFFDKPELTVADNCEKRKKDDKLATKTTYFEPTTAIKEEKNEKITNIRKRRCSTAENTPTPVSTDHKTILFNPKTGQVIRRN